MGRQIDRQKKLHIEVGAPPKNLCEGHHFFGCTPTFLSIPCLSSVLILCRTKICSRKWWVCWQTTSQKYLLIYSMNFIVASKRKTTKEKKSTVTNFCFLILDYLESWFNLMIISVVYFREQASADVQNCEPQTQRLSINATLKTCSLIFLVYWVKIFQNVTQNLICQNYVQTLNPAVFA